MLQRSLQHNAHQPQSFGNMQLEELLLGAVCPFQIPFIVLEMEAPRWILAVQLAMAGQLICGLLLLVLLKGSSCLHP